MKSARFRFMLTIWLAGIGLGWGLNTVVHAAWTGVDETVVEKYAEQAGHPAQAPLINTDQGDLLLFVFLLAGIMGGFVLGYNFRVLFPPRDGRSDNHG